MNAEVPQIEIADEFPPVPAGALRIMARCNDTQILIVHGDDHYPKEGERLAFEEWFPSIEVAKAMSHFCSARLMSIGLFRPDADGWHPFSVANLKTLVCDAKTNLNVTFFPPPPKPAAERQAWTGKRIAWLGFLVGQGWTAKAIAADALIRSTAGNVYRTAHRFGLHLSESPHGHAVIRLPLGVQDFYARAAERSNLTRDAYIRRILIEKAKERVPETA